MNTSVNRRIILIYHSVGGGPLSTNTERFKEQMEWLSRNAAVVNLDVLLDVKTGKVERPQVVLTFDDGYRTLHDVVEPILKQHGFPATVYLNSGHITDGKHEPSDASKGHYPNETFMTWDEVVDLYSRGWVIGSHGVQHLDLTVLPELEILTQINESKRKISENTGKDCIYFSYTWGHFNPVVRKFVIKAGYQTAVAGIHRAVSEKSDIFALPRLDVRSDYELEDFAAIVSGDWDYLGCYQKLRSVSR